MFQSVQNQLRSVALGACVVVAGCGVKGPPLPPIPGSAELSKDAPAAGATPVATPSPSKPNR